MEKLKVLIVDDEPGIRSGIERILRNYTVGYPFMEEDFAFDLLQAETGEIAIDIIDNQKVDIILLIINCRALMGSMYWSISTKNRSTPL